MPVTYTLITGASQGIGRALTEECARRGHNLILVALPDPGFIEMGRLLEEKYGIAVRVVECDLTIPYSVDEVFSICTSRGYEINILINNVGIGFLGYFENANRAGIEKVIQLNVVAVTLLCSLFIPTLSRNSPSYILNVASLAAYYPMPFKSIYAASKSFVYSFSRALREELKPRGISVSILNPGPVLTNANAIKASLTMGPLARLGIVPPPILARRAIRRMMNGKAIIIPGLYNRLLVGIQRIVPPSSQAKFIARIFRKTQLGTDQQRTSY